MSRPALRRIDAAVDEAPSPADEFLLTIRQLAERLSASRSKIERDILDGLPAIDIGRHDPRRRVKRSLRFSWPAVIAWYQGSR